MNNKILYVVRGLPGAGKSTLGAVLAKSHCYAADDWMVDENGEYKFDPTKLNYCHNSCFSAVCGEMKVNTPTVAVCNTFSQEWEFARYINAAYAHGYMPIVLNVASLNGNVHGAPTEQVLRMHARFDWDPYPALCKAHMIMSGGKYDDKELCPDEIVCEVLHGVHKKGE